MNRDEVMNIFQKLPSQWATGLARGDQSSQIRAAK